MSDAVPESIPHTVLHDVSMDYRHHAVMVHDVDIIELDLVFDLSAIRNIGLNLKRTIFGLWR